MIPPRTIYRSLMLAIVLAWLTVAFAIAQGSIVVLEGETRNMKVDIHTGSSYEWTVYNESTFKIKAASTEVKIVTGQGTNSVTIQFLKPGFYYSTVVETDQSGCTNTKAVVVEVKGKDTIWPVAKISNQTVLIGNSKYILSNSCEPTIIDASASTGDGLVFRWDPPLYLDNPAVSKPKFTPGITTSYTLTVTDIYGHSSTETVGIMVAQAPKAEAGDNIYIGLNQSAMLDGSKSAGENLGYFWRTTTGRIREGGASPRPVIDQPGKYFLTVTDQYGCSNTDSVIVNLYTLAYQDTINTVINVMADVNVLWNDLPQRGLNPATLKIVTPPANGMATIVADSVINYSPNSYYVGSDSFVYSICDYNSSCDEATVLVFINDNPFFIPDAFSPNGDGINDKFEIKGIAKYKTVSIQIFNRWGNIVFESANYGEGAGKEGFWNGNSKSGGPVPVGTYFYVLRLDGKENITGSVYIGR